jgi:glucose-1-phosphate adenylyltransferase
MAMATQYKAHSLIRHCQRGWNFFRAERNEYLDILPASQRVERESQWYLGTADAVTQNIDIVDSYDVEYVLILAGDHIYKMDYERMIAAARGKRRRRHRRLPHRAARWRRQPSA